MLITYSVLIFYTILCTLVWAYVSRMCGGAYPKLTHGKDQWYYAIPYFIAGLLAALSSQIGIGLGFWWFIGISLFLGLLSFGLAFLGKRTGHGQWFDLGWTTKIIKAEFLDHIVRLFYGKDPNETTIGKGSYWRDFTGLAISGLFINLGIVITLFVTGYPLWAILALVVGLCKALAYVHGWKLYPNYSNNDPEGSVWKIRYEFNTSTEIGEFETGLYNVFPIFAFIFYIILL